MFNFKAFSLLIAALFFGVGAAFFANNWLQQQASTRVLEAVIERQPVLVAARIIEFGVKLEESDIRVVDWPVDLLPDGVLGDQSLAVGRIASQKLLMGEPLLAERLVDRLSGSALSAMIAPNKRAITVRVNDVAGVAGFLLPGNRVDVLGTRMVNGRANTVTVLQNIKVLAVDQKTNHDKNEPTVVRAVTLEASMDESIILVKTTEEGSVRMVLRNPEDIAMRTDVLPVTKVAKVARVRVPQPTVRIIRGTSVDRLAVQN